MQKYKFLHSLDFSISIDQCIVLRDFYCASTSKVDIDQTKLQNCNKIKVVNWFSVFYHLQCSNPSLSHQYWDNSKTCA